MSSGEASFGSSHQTPLASDTFETRDVAKHCSEVDRVAVAPKGVVSPLTLDENRPTEVMMEESAFGKFPFEKEGSLRKKALLLKLSIVGLHNPEIGGRGEPISPNTIPLT